MRSAQMATMFCGMLLLSGCATLFDRGSAGAELVGRSVRLVPAQGLPSTLSFGGDGVVRSTFGERSATGRWWVQRRQLCFLWSGSFRECWPYRAPFPHRRTVRIRSDRGNLVRVTLL